MSKRITVFTNNNGDAYEAQRWSNYGKTRIYVYKNAKEFGYYENGVLYGKSGGRIKETHFGEKEISHANFLTHFELLEIAGDIPVDSHKPEQQMVYESIKSERQVMHEDNDLDEQFWRRDA